MSPEAAEHIALRAYEVGRARTSALRALAVSIAVALVGLVVAGPEALTMLPLTFAIWLVAHWRGGPLLRGAVYGLAGGVVTLLLPLSILRPCCAAGMKMTADCCTMPAACVGAGAVVGLALAATVPYGKTGWRRMAIGLVLGMTSIAILRCATLFAGESLGLIGGIVLGLTAAAGARAVWARRAA